MKQILCVLLMVFAGAANAAVVVNVGGASYSVDYFEGTYTDNVALLQEQVWWGDGDLALEFATQGIEAGLGYPNLDGGGSPAYAYAAADKVGFAGVLGWIPLGAYDNLLKQEWSLYYAVATQLPSPPSAVPLPAAGYLFLSALVALFGRGRLTRRR